MEWVVSKRGRCVGLTKLPPSCADCLEIWDTQHPVILWACPGLYWDWLTFCMFIATMSTRVFFWWNIGDTKLMENWRRKYGLFFWKKRTNNTFSQRSETFIGNFRHTWSLDKWKIWVTWSVSAGGNLQFLQNSSTAVSNEPVTVIALSPVCTTFLTLFTTFFKQHNWKKIHETESFLVPKISSAS